MATQNDTTPTSQETLYIQLNQASLKLTYAKCLATILSDEAEGLAGRVISVEREDQIHALCHSIELMVDQAQALIEDRAAQL